MNRNYSFQDGVKQEVLALIKRRAKPGQAITGKDLKRAYEIVRTNAIADTIFWKKMFITIEEL